MNPFQAIMGGAAPAPVNPPAQMPMNAGINGIFGRAQQLAGILQNPQTLVQRFFPDAPAEVSGDPEQLLGWMQQSGRVTPQMVQMARSMMNGR